MCEENYGFVTEDGRFFLDYSVCQLPYTEKEKTGGLELKHEKMKRIESYFNNIINREEIIKPNVQYDTINRLTWRLFGCWLKDLEQKPVFTRNQCSFAPRAVDITPDVQLNKFTNLTDAMNYMVDHHDIRKNDTIVVTGILMSMLMVEEWDNFSKIIRRESLRPVFVLQDTSTKSIDEIAHIVKVTARKIKAVNKQIVKYIEALNEHQNKKVIRCFYAKNLIMDYEQGIFAVHKRSVITASQFSCANLEEVQLHLWKNTGLSDSVQLHLRKDTELRKGVKGKLARYLSPLKRKEDIPLR